MGWTLQQLTETPASHVCNSRAVFRRRKRRPEPSPARRGQRRIGLVGCVKEKAVSTTRARDLYTSPLFRGRRRFVERTCDEWWILSAEHGLVSPEQRLAPYDTTLKAMSAARKRGWSAEVLDEIRSRVRPERGDVVEFHAGADYREFGLAAGLRKMGLSVENPTQGMPIGAQLSFYRQAS